MVVALTMATQKTAPSQKACTLQHPSLPAPASQRSLMHSGLEVALEARAAAPVALKVSCTPSNSRHWQQEWQLSHLQRAIEKRGQTWKTVF